MDLLHSRGNKDNHKSLDVFEFLPDSTLATELAALECLKNQHLHFFSVDIDLILFKLADNEKMHILNVIQFWPDWTT